MPVQMRFAQVLEELLDEKYRRNRAALADAAHVSPSALSQYVRGKATPSLAVLVDLAEALQVSLDHLVFGSDHPSSLSDAQHFASHLEDGIRRAQSDAAVLHDLVAKVGARLGQQVRDVAQEFLREASTVGGTLDFQETILLERCSTRTAIVTANLDDEARISSTAGTGAATAPGQFTSTVIENIAAQSRYEFFIPVGPEAADAASRLRELVITRGGLDAAVVDRNLKITQIPRACVPGYVLYHVPVLALQKKTGDMYDRLAQFLVIDSLERGSAHIAIAEPASRSYQHNALIDGLLVPGLVQEIRSLRKASAHSGQSVNP